MAQNDRFPSPFISNDYYTEPFFMKGEPGLYADIRGRFRRMAPQTRGQLFTALEQLPDEGARYVHQARHMVEGKFLVEWDVRDRKGEPVPLTSENFARLTPRAYFRLIAILLGNEAPDYDGAAGHNQGTSPNDLLSLSLAGEIIPMDEADAKNSATG